MAKFAWEGTTRAGEKRRGVMEAENRTIVEERLRSDNINVSSVKREGGLGDIQIQIGSGVSAKDLQIFTRQLATMIDAAPATSAPALFNASIVSRVEPPVVITSSTTNVFSPGETVNPRRNVIAPPSRSVQINRAPNARATSCPITIPPIAGDATS